MPARFRAVDRRFCATARASPLSLPKSLAQGPRAPASWRPGGVRAASCRQRPRGGYRHRGASATPPPGRTVAVLGTTPLPVYPKRIRPAHQISRAPLVSQFQQGPIPAQLPSRIAPWPALVSTATRSTDTSLPSQGGGLRLGRNSFAQSSGRFTVVASHYVYYVLGVLSALLEPFSPPPHRRSGRAGAIPF